MSMAREVSLAFDIPASHSPDGFESAETSAVSRCRVKQIRPADLQESSLPILLLKEGHCFRENKLSVCRQARLELNVIFESGQFATILAMVAADAGLSVVPQMAVEQGRGCRFIPIADEGAHRRTGIVQLKQRFRSRAHRAFLKHLQQRAARL